MGVGFQVLAQAVAEGLGAHQALELAHHDGRFVVDDVAVERARILQVGQRLANGVGPGRAVDAVGGGVVVDDEFEVVVRVFDGHLGDFVGHEIGKDLLHPHVVEPLHGYQIAEPHVGRLVRDEVGAGQHLVLGRALVQKQRRGLVVNGPDVLHPAVLKIRNGHKIKLLKRKRQARVLLHKTECIGVQLKNGAEAEAQRCGVGFAVQEAHGAAV